MRIKRLDSFMLQSFVPLFGMTFFICLFIVLMQFLWRFIDDLVGKGLGVDVIAELFFYAALTMIPMALPLAVLLASLMIFGNLGERFELTAMKAAGISLTRAMLPLIWLMVFIAVGAFFFQNNVLPLAQTKMWTLLYSMRQKSPELEIPEGIFYDQIPGYNIFVREKNRRSGVFYDMMIYDVSRGADNAMVILADSGRIAFTEDKTHLYLHLWQGESFENLRDASSTGGAGSQLKNVPYRRESFDDKELIVPFDANFNRMDEQGMRNQYVGKNITELQQTIDSIGERVDSVSDIFATELRRQLRLKMPPLSGSRNAASMSVPHDYYKAPARPIDIDSLLKGGTASYRPELIDVALTRVIQKSQELDYRTMALEEDVKNIRRHGIEMHKKFTLSFACIIFFFIGAPLGAIIRKGGLGVPVVISVFLFIVYYIIDNTGYKMAREGRMEVWEGMWLSSAVLLPLGIFLTYKAVNDSAVFNPDAWTNMIRRLTGRRGKRTAEYREVTMDDFIPQKALAMLEALDRSVDTYLASNPAKQNFIDYWLHGYDRAGLKALSEQLEQTVAYLSNSRDRALPYHVAELPVLRSLWVYRPTRYRGAAMAAMALFPLSIPLWIAGRREQRILRAELEKIKTVNNHIRTQIQNDTP